MLALLRKHWHKIMTAPVARAVRRPFRRRSVRPELEVLERRELLTTVLVTTNADSGPGSLRQAILICNAAVNQDANNTIDFDMPARSQNPATTLPYNIALASPLPVITTDFLDIDATTDPGYSAGGGVPYVAIDGDAVSTPAANAAGTAVGLDTSVFSVCTVKGLIIIGFGDDGIVINGNTSVIQDNVIGYAGGALGASASTPNGRGIQVNGDINTIGGTTPSTRNIIADNNASGVVLAGWHNSVVGNYIGVQPNGLTASGNANGVLVTGYTNVVGGTLAADANVISGNTQDGVLLTGTGSTNNDVLGNFIGVAPGGMAPLANGENGVDIEGGAADNVIGGIDANVLNLLAANGGNGQNVISGNVDDGVQIGGGSDGNTVEYNLIGLNATGAAAIANDGHGVNVLSASANNNVLLNTISGNALSGVLFYGAGTTGNLAQSNRIGTNAAGNSAIPNNGNGGVSLAGGASGNTVNNNLVSGNINGVFITDAGTSNNTVSGCLIGTNGAGTGPLANTAAGVVITAGASNNTIDSSNISDNGSEGVLIEQGASGNTIGGAGSGNIIDNNTTDGVEILNGTTVHNTISSNDIYGNGGIGIDLGGFGVLPNSPNGPHAGPNDLQNTPILLNDSTPGLVTGYLNSTPATTFTLEFFASPTGDNTHPGEGRDLLGATTVTTDLAGNVDFSFAFTPLLGVPFLTATATSASGDTSEFSPSLAAGLTCNGLALTGDLSTPFAGTVATFADANPLAPASNFTATINWGDGSSSAGTVIAGTNNSFTVAGSHQYLYATAAIELPLTVTITDLTSNTQTVANSTMSLVYGLQGIAKTVPYIEGIGPTAPLGAVAAEASNSIYGDGISLAVESNPSTVVASFFDTDPHAYAGVYTATINWGDAPANGADTSTGTVVADGDGFDVVGSHIYAQAGVYPMTITVTSAYGASTTIDSTAVVSLQPLTLDGVSVAVPANSTFNGIVATLYDPDPRIDPTFYTATVTWDNGTTSPGTVTGSNPFTITASHAFGAFNNTAIETVTVTDKLGRTATVSDRFVDPPGTETPHDGAVGVKYDDKIAIAGGTKPGTPITLGDFNGGGTGLTAAAVTINAATDTIVVDGTPTAGGTASFTVNLTNPAGEQISQEYSVAIVAPLTVSGLSETQWTTDAPGFTGVSTVSGGVGPYTLAGATGLPAGLHAVLNGTTISFTGAPTTARTYDADITIRDAAGVRVTRTFVIKINAVPTLGKLTTTQWTVNKSGFTGSLTIAGGTGSFVIANVSGLPTGLTAVVTGHEIHFTGTPSAAQSLANGSITLEDAAGASVTRTFTITINPPLQIITSTLPPATTALKYDTAVQASGGTGTIAFTISAGRLPPGLKLSRSGVISGVSQSAGVYSFTVTATDAIDASFNEEYTLSVSAGQ